MGVAFSLVIIAVERYLSVIRSFNCPSAKYSCWRSYLPPAALILTWILAIGIIELKSCSHFRNVKLEINRICSFQGSGIPNLWYYETASVWTYINVNGTIVRPRNETCETYYLCLRTDFDMNNAGTLFKKTS
jgi:hypothetical protein